MCTCMRIERLSSSFMSMHMYVDPCLEAHIDTCLTIAFDIFLDSLIRVCAFLSLCTMIRTTFLVCIDEDLRTCV